MGQVTPRRPTLRPRPDPLTRVVTAVLYAGLTAAVAFSLWSGIHNLSSL
jgi:hypothetical protein